MIHIRNIFKVVLLKFSKITNELHENYCKISRKSRKIWRRIQVKQSRWNNASESGVGRGDRGNAPPETEKIVVESWCYFPEVYSFEARGRNHQKISWNFWKSQLSIEILIKKSQKFLTIFQKFGLFWSNSAKFCTPVS